MRPLSLHTSSEIVPGALPCTSSSRGAVTSASAMSGVESDTLLDRPIGMDDGRSADQQENLLGAGDDGFACGRPRGPN